jgi:hypothetical protein
VWIITAWQCISPEVTVKGFISNAMVGTDDVMLWNTVKRMGMLGVNASMIQVKALTVKMETPTLIDKGR